MKRFWYTVFNPRLAERLIMLAERLIILWHIIIASRSVCFFYPSKIFYSRFFIHRCYLPSTVAITMRIVPWWTYPLNSLGIGYGCPVKPASFIASATLANSFGGTTQSSWVKFLPS